MYGRRVPTANRRVEHYDRLPREEYERRWSNLRELLDSTGYDAVVAYGAAGLQGPIVEYYTNYSPNFATYFVAFRDRSAPNCLFVGISNHLQYAREVSEVDEVRVMIPDPPATVADWIETARPDVDTVGLVGFDPRYDLGMPHAHYEHLDNHLDAALDDLTGPVVEMISVKSEEELRRVKAAASALDDGMEALARRAEPGMTERDLRSVLASAMETDGGGLTTSFISSAPMTNAEPGEPLPWKQPSGRRFQTGDVITTEICANVGGYSSQIHRPFTVGEPPTECYRDMFVRAEDCYDDLLDAVRPGNTAKDVYEAIAPLEDSEYKIYDVVVHGYGDGYFHPFIGTSSSNYWPGIDDEMTAEWTFKENSVLAIQPNVVTEDERKGLQLGTTVVVCSNGAEVLQEFPVEFLQV